MIFPYACRAAALLAGAAVLGVDCEWQPAGLAAPSSEAASESATPVSLLQVCTLNTDRCI